MFHSSAKPPKSSDLVQALQLEQQDYSSLPLAQIESLAWRGYCEISEEHAKKEYVKSASGFTELSDMCGEVKDDEQKIGKELHGHN